MGPATANTLKLAQFRICSACTTSRLEGLVEKPHLKPAKLPSARDDSKRTNFKKEMIGVLEIRRLGRPGLPQPSWRCDAGRSPNSELRIGRVVPTHSHQPCVVERRGAARETRGRGVAAVPA